MTRIITTIAAAALFAASASGASAVKLNNKAILLGNYCWTEDYIGAELVNTNKYPERDRQEAVKKCGDRVLTFSSDGYEGLESGCSYVSVKTWYDPTIPTATKTPTGALVSRTISQCAGEGCTWREVAIMYHSKGYLYFNPRHLGKEKCVKPDRYDLRRKRAPPN